eukprot:UN08959
MAQLFDNLETAGVLLLNATPVLHPDRKPQEEARYWLQFLDRLLQLIASHSEQTLTVILWGKIASLVAAMPASKHYNQLACEHPYNLSFIDNPQMQTLFANLKILDLPDQTCADFDRTIP